MKHPVVDPKNPHPRDVIIRVRDYDEATFVSKIKEIPCRASYVFEQYGFKWAITPFYVGDGKFSTHYWTLTEVSTGYGVRAVHEDTVCGALVKAMYFILIEQGEEKTRKAVERTKKELRGGDGWGTLIV